MSDSSNISVDESSDDACQSVRYVGTTAGAKMGTEIIALNEVGWYRETYIRTMQLRPQNKSPMVIKVKGKLQPLMVVPRTYSTFVGKESPNPACC